MSGQVITLDTILYCILHGLPVDFFLGVDATDDRDICIDHHRDFIGIELDVCIDEEQMSEVCLEEVVCE